MRVLLLTFYFQPDLCAGSFRATALVSALQDALPADSEIEVVTTLPNRYHSYRADAPHHERSGKVSITRIALPTHRSGMLDQSRAFLAFAKEALDEVRGRKYDVVVATSSRLMTAVLGAWVARRGGAPLYLDVRDIFTDTIKDVAPRAIGWATQPIFAALERWAVTGATRVNLVSRGFGPDFARRYPRQRFSFFSNGIDEEFLSAAPSGDEARPLSDPSRPATVVYAGNVGEAQGLHEILPELAARLGESVRFQVIGDGGRRKALVAALARQGVSNVELLPPMPRTDLLRHYRAADILFLHLNDHAAFKKVLPSKIFEYAALGKPIWAGVAGHAAEFLAAEVPNSAVFPPCDAESAVSALGTLRLETVRRGAFLARYGRAEISRGMAADVVAIVDGVR